MFSGSTTPRACLQFIPEASGGQAFSPLAEEEDSMKNPSC